MQQTSGSSTVGFGPKLVAVGQAWRRALGHVLADQGLSEAAALPLLCLAREGEVMRQGRLAARLGLEGTSVVRTLDALASNGLVKRTADADDRRAKHVALTDAGRSVAAHIETLVAELREDLFADVEPEDLEALDRALSAIGRRLEQREQARRSA